MKKSISFILCLFVLLASGFAGTAPPAIKAADSSSDEPAQALKHSADWQLNHPSGIDTRDWIIAPLYDGLLRLATTMGDPKYLAAVLRPGTQSGWLADNRIYHADDYAVGHAWLDVYLMNTNRAGFAWAGDGEMTTGEQWLQYLAKTAAR